MRGRSDFNAVANETQSGEQIEDFASSVSEMIRAVLDGGSEIVLYSPDGEQSQFKVNAYLFFGLLSTVGAIAGNLVVLCILCFLIWIRRLCKCSPPPPVDTTVVHASEGSIDSEIQRDDSDEEEMREARGKRTQTFVS